MLQCNPPSISLDMDESRHGCKPKPENIRSNSKSLPTLATIVVENYAAVAAYLNNTEPRAARLLETMIFAAAR